MRPNYSVFASIFLLLLIITAITANGQSKEANDSIANAYYETGTTFELQSKFKESVAAQQKAFIYYQKTGNEIGSVKSLNRLGYSNFKLKKYPLAKDFYTQAVDRAQRNAAFEQLVDAYDGLANVYEAQKDFKKAISAVRFMQGAYDSIVNRDHKIKIDDLEEKYSTLLAEKDRQLVEAERQHRQVKTQGLLRMIEREDIRLTFYAVALALTFVVLCLAGLWFATRRTARKAEQSLRVEQATIKTANEQFEIISKHFHDQLTKPKAESLVRDMMEIIWLINPNNQSLESLITYIRDQTNTLLKLSGVNYMIVFPDKMPNVQLTSLERVNLFFVTRELIRYAAESSKATGLTVSLIIEGRQMIFKVKDNSMPVDEARAKSRAEEIKPLRERMEEIDGTIGIVIEQGAMVVIYRKDLP